MKRTIYRNMLFLCFVGIIVITAFLSVLFSNELSGRVRDDIRAKCVLIEKVLNSGGEGASTLNALDFRNSDIRVTLVSASGVVLYDNSADISKLENHADRAEIVDALLTGSGESKRFSETLREETYYYALKLISGAVVRVSKTTSSLYGVFYDIIPLIIGLILAILILCHFVAQRLTKRIIEPINRFNFNDNVMPYDELSPFIGTITNQQKLIDTQTDELDERSAIMKALNDSMKEGLILLDKNGIVLSANDSTLRLYQKDKSAIGKNIIELTRNVHVIEHVSSALSGEQSDLALSIGKRTYNVFFSPLMGKGVLILYVDITERAEAEKRRQAFSANVSHELKTPLTSIFGYAELIENGMVSQHDTMGFAGKIKSEASRLITLINDIIRLSELDETLGPKIMEEIQTDSLCRDVIDSLSQKAAAHNVALELACQDRPMKGNRQMLFEMLYNLIDNGIKYNQGNGKVSLAVAFFDNHVTFNVSDTGIGIPRDDFDRIFERFYRVDKSRSKKTGGTGLGLSIVKHAVSYHGGEISVESRENEGTEITITLPLGMSANKDLQNEGRPVE